MSLFALASVALPAAAVAQGGVKADSYPVQFSAEPVGTVTFSYEGLSPTTCSEASLAGEAEGPTGTMALSSPEWECKEETVESTCSWEFHPGSENSVDLGPPGCSIKGLKIGSCFVNFYAQTGIPVTYEDVMVNEKEAIRATINSPIESEHCAWVSGDPTLNATWDVSGFESIEGESGPQIDIYRVDGLNAFFITGEESEEESKQPKFESEEYPNTVTGSLVESKTAKFILEGVTYTCNSGDFTGSLAEAGTQLQVDASLSGCNSEAVVSMNSCHLKYTLSNLTSGWLYFASGGQAIECDEEGDVIEIEASNCVAHIPPQTLSKSLATFENFGSGSTRYVKSIGTAVKGLTYLYKSGFCVLLGEEHNDGEIAIGTYDLRGP
ncbi:MAG TPA: hypothetical protein VFT19_12785 [Solirubrobacterales bacterium]|nr:hypothetical protein [Solirubrobacterales bacterium]